MNMSNHFPKMLEMGQSYPPSQKLDFSGLLEEQFTQSGLREKIKPGMRIALGVGSRGITNLKEIVKATLGVLTKAGARPFIVPAMGSHGGATAEGQIEMLAGLRGHDREHGRPHRSQHGGEKDRHGIRRARCGL